MCRLPFSFIHRHCIPLAAVIVMLATGYERAQAQEPLTSGKQFLVVFPDTAMARIGTVQAAYAEDVQVILWSDSAASVRLSGIAYNRIVSLQPGISTTVSLRDPTFPLPRPIIDTTGVRWPQALRIESDQPIQVLCHTVTRSGGDAFTPLPVAAWGTRYTLLSLRNQFFFHVGFNREAEELLMLADAPAQAVIIAAEDSTTVHITPTTPLLAPDTVVTLNAGESWLLNTEPAWNLDTAARDLCGTRIVSNKPVGVISGNTRTQGGSGAHNVSTPTGNSLDNQAVEWLIPDSLAGTIVAFRSMTPIVSDSIEEIVRVVATEPGTTTLYPSTGYPAKQLNQGEIARYAWSSGPDPTGRRGTVTTPFSIRADRPIQAFSISGSLAEVEDPLASLATFRTWSPSMSLLTPRERWWTHARFHSPSLPTRLSHYALIIADSGTTVQVDTTVITFEAEAIPGTPYRHARIALAAGDHTIRAFGGRCCATAYGVDQGHEEFAPPGTRDKDQKGLAHPSRYLEVPSACYSYPIDGTNDRDLPPDSLTITRVERCDSAVITVVRVGDPWLQGPLTVTVDSGSVNADVKVELIPGGSVTIGYTIRFRPIDPLRDASGTVTITNLRGQRWTIPWAYVAGAIKIDPNPIIFVDVDPDNIRSIVVHATDASTRNLTVLSARMAIGTWYSVTSARTLPAVLRPAQALDLTVTYHSPPQREATWDTLIVETECGTARVLVRARPGPWPLPTITGYDWKVRRVGSSYDTLSFLGNDGTRPYTPASVTIVGDVAGAFQLVAPDWRGIAAVDPSEVERTGIRFTPPRAGTYTASIRLATTDGDTVEALLRGSAIEPSIGGNDISLPPLCLNGLTRIYLRFSNSGQAPLTIYGFDLKSVGAADGVVDTLISPPLTIQPGGSLQIPLIVRALSTGAYTLTLTAHSDARGTDSTASVSGAVGQCDSARLRATDHDFGSIYISLDAGGNVWVVNETPTSAVVDSMQLTGDTVHFHLLSPSTPFTVPGLDSVRIDLLFSPDTVGPYTAAILYHTNVGPLLSRLVGRGRKLIVPAFIRRDYHAQPGEELTIYVELSEPLDTAPVRRLDLAITYDTTLLSILAVGPARTRQGWSSISAIDGDTIHSSISTAGSGPPADSLLAIRSLIRLTFTPSSELPFTVTSGLPYVEIVTSPGLVVRDPFCGLQQRLFEFVGPPFVLGPVVPSPTPRSSGGTISFTLPFDNPTTLIAYDVFGVEQLRLVDAPYLAGSYTITIPPNALPAGLYYLRLRSGTFQALRRLIVQ